MKKKEDNSPFLLYFSSLSVTAIFLTVILLPLATSTIFSALGLIINQNHIAIAQQQQQQPQVNLTSVEKNNSYWKVYLLTLIT
jgi:hypothetical protein